jgi:hypothetical protein
MDNDGGLWRAAALRVLIGFPVGVMISTIFALVNSFVVGDGMFHPVAPAMLEWASSGLAATFWQFILSGILGSICAGTSIIFEIDGWSLTKQTVVHFFALVVPLVSIAILCGWTGSFGFWGITFYLLSALLIYFVIWVASYQYWKNWIRKANAQLKRNAGE